MKLALHLRRDDDSITILVVCFFFPWLRCCCFDQVHVNIFLNEGFSGNFDGTDVLSISPDPVSVNDPRTQVFSIDYESTDYQLRGFSLTAAALINPGVGETGQTILSLSGDNGIATLTLEYGTSNKEDIRVQTR